MHDPNAASAPELELLKALDGMHWQSRFDTQSMARGLSYADGDRVREWDVLYDGKSLLLEGVVRGSGRSPYHVRVYVWKPQGEATLISTCSCPVGRQCKHAVALIQDFVVETAQAPRIPQPPSAPSAPTEPDAVERAWLSWMRSLPSADDATVLERVGADRQFALFVRIESDSGRPQVKVAPVWLRPSRGKTQERMVDPLAVQLTDDSLTPAPPAGWDAELERRLMLLMHGATQGRGIGKDLAWVTVSRPFQAEAFRALVTAADAPLLFHDKQTGRRLVVGPGRRADVAWQRDEAGVQRLVWQLEDAEALSRRVALGLVGRELWYLDSGTGVLGPVAGDLNMLLAARSAPALPAEKARWLAEHVKDGKSAGPGLPSPEVLPEQVIEGGPSGLRVHLSMKRFEPWRWPQKAYDLGAGAVYVDYGEDCLPMSAAPVAHVVRYDKLSVVKRDLEAERLLLEALPKPLIRIADLMQHCRLRRPEQHGDDLLMLRTKKLPDTMDQWPKLLAAPEDWEPMIGKLRRLGVRVTFADGFPRPAERLAPDAWYGELEPVGNGWFDLALDIEVDGERVNLLPILRGLLRDARFPLKPVRKESAKATWDVQLDEDRILVLPVARLRSLMAPILDWLREGPTGDELRLPVTAAAQLEPLAESEQWQGRNDVAALAGALAELPDTIAVPAGFVGELRDYQARGVAWMRRLAVLQTGGILADDMGLGKTIQVLAHILDERARGTLSGPVLVVATTSLVGNWCAEAARFCPGLNVLSLQLPKGEREAALHRVAEADLVVTTYQLLVRDQAALEAERFALVILDEAQAIKNAASQAAKAVRALRADRRLAMTGTPLENHLGELWAQLDAVAPGFLGAHKWFGRHYRTPIERQGDDEARQRLARRIGPLMLRRTRDQVLTELPEKTESLRSVALSGAQRELYESLRLAQHQRVQQSIAERGLAQSGIVMLDALLKLRQVCCDPRLVKLASARAVKRSAKLDQLRELLPTLIEQGRRILIFSQFTEMLDLISTALDDDGIAFETLTGQTPGVQRKARVARFQEGAVPVFLISLKAGGVGLNLTTADTVIHYDPWWNPAVEAQATGRAHRMGQRNPVMVYKLVCSGTVEERITELQARKADLAASILAQEGEATRTLALDQSELDALFAPMTTAT